jgi:hypothetical protein
MAWVVRFSKDFEQWFRGLRKADQDALAVDMKVLASEGPQLGRPHVDTLKGSRHANLKELRTGTFRCAFAFDLQREAVMLVGDDKKGKDSDLFYETLIERADELLDAHLAHQKVAMAKQKKEEAAAEKKQKENKKKRRGK